MSGARDIAMNVLGITSCAGGMKSPPKQSQRNVWKEERKHANSDPEKRLLIVVGSVSDHCCELLLSSPHFCFAVLCLVAQSGLILCNPTNCSLPLSVRILQAKILQWVAMTASRGFSQPRNRTRVSCIAGRFFTS